MSLASIPGASTRDICGAAKVGEVDPTLAVDRDVVGASERLALELVGQNFHLPGAQVRSRDPPVLPESSRRCDWTPGALGWRLAGPPGR